MKHDTTKSNVCQIALLYKLEHYAFLSLCVHNMKTRGLNFELSNFLLFDGNWIGNNKWLSTFCKLRLLM